MEESPNDDSEILAPDSQGSVARAISAVEEKRTYANEQYVYVPETQEGEHSVANSNFGSNNGTLAPDSQGTVAHTIAVQRRPKANAILEYFPESETQMSTQTPSHTQNDRDSNNNNRSNIPSNYTLQSMGRNVVVIIRPTNPNINMMHNPIKFQKAFEQTPFSKYEIKDVRTNVRLNIITVELDNSSASGIILDELIKVVKIGQWDVQCSIPDSDRYKVGVVSPIGFDTDLDVIKDYIKTRDASTKIAKVERLKRKTEDGWTDSVSIKITFEAKELPSSITIAHGFYRVRPYVREPRQCYKCQRMGHVANSCKSQKMRCLLCGDNHPKEKCSRMPNNFTCANCNGNHKANSRECHYYDTACRIEQERAKKNKSYQSAREAVIGRPSVNEPANQQIRNMNYRSAVIGSFGEIKENTSNTRTRVTMKDAFQQTDPEPVNASPPLPQQPQPLLEKTFFEKLKLILIEVLQVATQKEDKTRQSNSIDKAIDRHFGTGVSMEVRNDDQEFLISDTNEEEVLSEKETHRQPKKRKANGSNFRGTNRKKGRRGNHM